MKSYIKQKATLDSDLLKYLRTSNINSIGSYHIGKTLGKGSFGKVKLGIHKLTGQKVAIKIVDKIHAPIVAREIETWRHLIHPNIIQLYEVITSETKIYMVIEYAEEGELFNFITKYGRINEKSVTAKRLFKQLVEAVQYCHQHNFVHRDLKLENVLLSSDFKIKLSDFGFTKEISSSKLLDTYCGSVAYSAPEMISGKKYNGPGADIWSLGVILYTMVCGTLPFDDEADDVIYQKILNLNYKIPDFISEDCKDLITRILKIEPSERMTIEEILNHKWMELPQEDNINNTQACNLSLSSININNSKLNSQSENDIKSLENIDLNLNYSLKNSERSLINNKNKNISESNNSMLISNGSLKSSNSFNSSISSLQSSNNSLNKVNRLLNNHHKGRMKQNLFININRNKEDELIFDETEKKLLENLEWIGFNTNAIKESIKNHSCNELSATWYLLLRKHKNNHYRDNIFDDKTVFCPSAEPWATSSKGKKFDLQPFSAPIRSSFTTNVNNRSLWATGTRKDLLNGIMKKNSPMLSTITQKQILTSGSKSYNNSPIKYSSSPYNNKDISEISNPYSSSTSPSNSKNHIMEEEEEEEEREYKNGKNNNNNELSFIYRKNLNSYSSKSNHSLLTNSILQNKILSSSTASDAFKKDFIKSEHPISAKIPTSKMVYSNSYSGDMNTLVHNINDNSKTYSPFQRKPKPKKSILPGSFSNHFALDEDGNDSSSNLISVDEEEGYEEEDYSSSYTCSSLKCKAFPTDELLHPASSLVTNSPLTMTTMIDTNEEEEDENDEEDKESNISGSINSIIGSRPSSEDNELNTKSNNQDQQLQKKPAIPTQNELNGHNSYNKFVKEKYSSYSYGKNNDNSNSNNGSSSSSTVMADFTTTNINEKSVNDFESSPRYINYTNSQFTNFSQFYSPTQNNEPIKLDIPDKFIAKSLTSLSSSGISETSGYNNDDYMSYFHPEANQTNNKTSY